MRILTLLGLSVAVLQGVAAVCNCPEIAATSVGCDLDDSECLCNADGYLDVVTSCARFRRGEECSDRDLQDTRDNYVRACLSNSRSTSEAPSSTSEPTSTSRSSSARTTSEPTTSTSTRSTTTSSSTSTMSPTSAPAASSSNSGLTTAQIGGIAGGSAGFLLLLAFLAIFLKFRKYKKKDQKLDAERNVEAEQFMDGGRQMRAASMSHISDRLYSTQRPLSHALGEYDSARYDAEEDESQETTPSNSLQGNYFNRFSGNHVEDSSSAFSSNSPQSYHPPSSYRNSMRSSSVPMYGPGGPQTPTASLSYEEYRNQAQENLGERSSLMAGQQQPGSSAPHRSVSAPMSQQLPRISRKPIGNSLSDRSSSGAYNH